MPRSATRRAAWIAAAAAMLAAGTAAGLLATRLGPEPAPRPGASAPASVAGPVHDSWWTPLPSAAAPFVPAQLVIERLRVEALVEVKGIDPNNVMEAPDRPADVAWYRFTSRPGAGSNAVFSGRRDSGRAGVPAVFLHLDQLGAGDLLDVVSAQRTEIRYRVSGTRDYALSGMPMQSVLATDRAEEITLITTSGTFSPGVGYDRRLVVRAVRTS